MVQRVDQRGEQFTQSVKIRCTANVQAIRINLGYRFRIRKHDLQDLTLTGKERVVPQVVVHRFEAATFGNPGLPGLLLDQADREPWEIQQGLDVLLIPRPRWRFTVISCFLHALEEPRSKPQDFHSK